MDVSKADEIGTSDLGDGNRWSRPRVLDVTSAILLGVVVVRAVGGVVAGLGIPSPPTPALPSSSGVVGQLSLFSVPTHLRIQYGTQWADVSSGILLLASVALLVLPRWIWNVQAEDRRRSAGLVIVVTAGAVAVMTATASLVGLVNAVSTTPGELDFTQASVIASSAASATLAGFAAILCWFGFGVVSGADG